MRPNLAVLRSAIGPLLTETGTTKRATGDWTFDEETGMETREYVTVYTGPMLVRPEGNQPAIVNVGGASWPRTPYAITLPAEADVRIGDVVTLTECQYDPQLVEIEITLTDAPLDSWAVARFCRGDREAG